jgi:putative ABC transport system permease protein
MDRYISERVSRLGSDVFVVSRFGILTNARQWVQAQKRPDLTLGDYEALRAGMREPVLVGATLSERGEASFASQTMRTSIRGVTPNMIEIQSTVVPFGRYLTDSDYLHRRQVCVIGQDVAASLFPNVDPVGKELRLNGQLFQVVGVAERVGSVFGAEASRFRFRWLRWTAWPPRRTRRGSFFGLGIACSVPRRTTSD